MLPITGRVTTFPAMRTTNRSPKPTSNNNSGGTRESLQPRMVAKGRCASVSQPRHSDDMCRNLGRPVTNLSFALDHALWGLDARGFHRTDVAILAGNALLMGFLAATQPTYRFSSP